MNKPASTPNRASVVGFGAGVAGVTPPSSSTGRQGVFLTDVIVELGFAAKERVDEAEEAARVSGKTVEQLLLDKGVVDDDQLSLAVAERNGLDHVDLDRFEVDMTAAATISRSVAVQCGAVPIARSAEGALIVAVQDSFDALAVRRIETATGSEARPVIAALGAIKRLIERLPDEAPAEATEQEVPRIKSQRELEVGGSDEPPESVVEGAEEPPVSQPPAPGPQPEPKAGDGGGGSFDGLSMDLGPMVMESSEEPVEPERPAEPQELAEPEKAKRPKKSAKREDGLARELVETKGRVAELERRLEEVIDAAEEAIPTSDTLSALRRAIDEDDS